MKKILLFSFLIISLFAFGQKVKFKKGDVLVDDKQWMKYEEDGLSYSIIDHKGNEVVFLKYVQQNPSNRMVFAESGKPNYYSVKFIGKGKTIEIRDFAEKIIAQLYKGQLFNSDFTINDEKMDVLVEKYGNDFSKNVENNSTQTVIIQESRPRNGVNISIGR